MRMVTAAVALLLALASLIVVCPLGSAQSLAQNAQVAAPAVWPKIDCNTSRLTVPGQVECRQGPPLLHTVYAGDRTIPIQCVGDHGSTYTQSADTSGFVKYNMHQPGSDAHCLTTGGANGPLSSMQHMNHTTSSAFGWGGVSQEGDRFFATFTSQRQKHCMAFLAPGPPVSFPYHVNKPSYSTDFYEYLLTGYLCKANGAPPDDAEVRAYIGTVHIRTQ